MKQAAESHDDLDKFVIDTSQEWQCRWWSHEFGVTPEELCATIRAVGTLARDVRERLAATRAIV